MNSHETEIHNDKSANHYQKKHLNYPGKFKFNLHLRINFKQQAGTFVVKHVLSGKMFIK